MNETLTETLTEIASPPLLLVDGSSYLFRAYFALPDLRTKDDFPTGAISGVANMLAKLRKSYLDSLIIVVFDAKGKTFRDELYEQYKGQRPPMPDDLRQQIEPIHQLVVDLGYPLIMESGVEADDVIGTLAVEASKNQQTVIIVTGDKDMAQLVDDRVSTFNPMNDKHYDRQGVIEKFGVPPEQIIDYLAVIGDKADNIPGIPGVGEKSAVPILQALGSIEGLYDDLEAIRTLEFRGAKKMPEKIAEHKDIALLSKLLATIKLDVELDLNVLTTKNGEPNKENLMAFYTRYEMGRHLRQIESAPDSSQSSVNQQANQSVDIEEQPSAPAFDSVPIEYETVLDNERWQHWLQQLSQSKLFAFDTETTSLNTLEAEIVGISVSIEPGKAIYVPFTHDYLGAPDQLARAQVLNDLKPLLESKTIGVIGQNLKYDISVLKQYDITIQGGVFDTMLQSYLLHSVGRHDMNSLADKHLGHQCVSFETIAGKGAKQLTFNQIDLELAGFYAAEDADVCLRLHQHFWPQLEAQPAMLQLYKEIEWPVAALLSQIEMSGTLVDAAMLHQQSKLLGVAILETQEQIFAIAGTEFNIGSPAQLQKVMYEEMGLPSKKKTPKGQPSTAEDALQELAESYEFPKHILHFRSLSKLKSTYTDKLPKMIAPQTGRIHTSYHQAVTVTGRLSSTDPNLQNIPIKSEQGRQIRCAFIAPEGYSVVAADYSQIELRIMAHLSGDETLQQAFINGLDVHSATAAEVFGVDIKDVSAQQRRSAKAINFGLMYGMSAFGLAKQLGEGRKQAQQYIDRYFERYPGVKQFMNQIRSDAKQNGYVETLFGRRLPLANINNSNPMLRQGAERAAINAPMQGTAADIIKKAMIDVQHWLKANYPDTILTMQVHDELVFEVKDSELEPVMQGIKDKMEAVGNDRLAVALEVEVNVGTNWNEAH